MEEFLRTADELADLGRSILRDGWWSVTTSTLKSDGSVLTSMDTLVEQRLRDHLRLRHPDHGILGEEFGADGIDRDYVWVLDSIDGTRSSRPGSCISAS